MSLNDLHWLFIILSNENNVQVPVIQIALSKPKKITLTQSVWHGGNLLYTENFFGNKYVSRNQYT